MLSWKYLSFKMLLLLKMEIKIIILVHQENLSSAENRID